MNIEAIIKNFDFWGTFIDCRPYGNGHINDTYLLTFEREDGERRFILQRMNTNVFRNPKELMENIENVTAWIGRKIRENGGDIKRETLNVIPDKIGNPYMVDEDGNCWRAFFYIEDTSCYDEVKDEKDFYESAVAFGNFQRLLADYPAETLHETIPDFHDTAKRFGTFRNVLNADVCQRAASVEKEIQFVLDREAYMHKLVDMLAQGILPLRVTHNDTKLNNVMIDNKTGRGICVIDLDTVMPGLSVYDFGDSIRFGASTAAEDEKNLDKVECDLHLFEVYTKGFVEGCSGALTDAEMDSLVDGAIMMTLECGMRFLTDYLDGDHYFKVHYEGQNLDRCRTQFKLVWDMEQKRDQMQEIVNQYR